MIEPKHVVSRMIIEIVFLVLMVWYSSLIDIESKSSRARLSLVRCALRHETAGEETRYALSNQIRRSGKNISGSDNRQEAVNNTG